MPDLQHYDVWRRGHRVLTFSTRPGKLVSAALHEPSVEAPDSPLVTAQSLDAMYESELATIIRGADSVPALIEKLERKGYDVRPFEDDGEEGAP